MLEFLIFIDPTLIGGPQADQKISKLGDVMCVTGLAVEFYELGLDREKYEKIMVEAGKTAKLHFSEKHKVFMENASLETGLDFSSPGGGI